ncbi:probable 1-acyl-sn-glycerol-3-phosphate acyltransferase 4 [Cajanus cajan]|uniref:1-acylglycerol-3-phosphate O-acyltransferase n=1 Tax=Cajanus cajan TaxID=3821 RepID=A0A151RWN8_CAJCA|nr:probable 1-acyl-sn-glycerol-3-phosphate acyltransferase 4 [Cajanus cajan]XP_020235434.1 probable 1-acyl-sn-glycerol-3-phosphate acyltransferase 4 [Cajanus cajan]XP_029130572.1 probable 1-acyl-sn-glycerol-3-phosphate acyltransferase 4 [Cajanus cajan]KYP46971.1 putative 1-acyl-sn-glycerol-3-phosphate acyltransferase 4 [Cajanus cajan]
MEVCGSIKSESSLKHRPLTPIRLLRGLICLVVFLSTAFMCLVYFTPVAVVGLRLFSIRCSRKTVSFIFGLWLSLWPFLFEKINKTKVVFSGDSIPMKERVLLIANHRTEVDWMYLWDLALRKGRLGCIKYILKSSLMKLPIFGWGFHILEFIAVERKWEIDEQILHQKLSTLKDPQDPLWLAIFPEGTDYTDKKSKNSQKFAAEAGLPVLTNVLLPKTKGFHACLKALRDSLDAVYDVTIAYKNQCPSFLDNVFGIDPSEVHMHVRRIPVEKIPTSETNAGSWLMNTFQIKDQLLSDFKIQGHFPNQLNENEISTFKSLLTVTLVVSVTVMFIYFTFFSLFWFKLYVGLSCAYLAVATCFNFQLMPLSNYVHALHNKKTQKSV